MATNADWSYALLSSGGSTILAKTILPLGETLVTEFAQHEEMPAEHRESTSPLFIKPRFRNSATLGLADSLFGVLVFLSAWGAKRFLDDIYEVKIRPHFRRLLGENAPEKKSSGTTSVKRCGGLFAIWHDKSQKGVVAAILGDSPRELLMSEDLVAQVQLQAERLIETQSPDKPVLLYVLDNGIAHDSVAFKSLSDAQEYLLGTGPRSDK